MEDINNVDSTSVGVSIAFDVAIEESKGLLETAIKIKALNRQKDIVINSLMQQIEEKDKEIENLKDTIKQYQEKSFEVNQNNLEQLSKETANPKN